MFGDLEGESEAGLPPQLLNGVPSEAASPWLIQRTHDLEFAAGVVDSEAIDEVISDMNMFSKEEMEDFCMVAMSILRASRCRVQIPPPGFQQADVPGAPVPGPDGDPQNKVVGVV